MPLLAQAQDTGNARNGATNARRRVIGTSLLVQFPNWMGVADR
jgi:hypothetical protein